MPYFSPFNYDVNSIFFLYLVSIPYSYYFSFLYPLKIIFLSVSHLIFIFLSYSSQSPYPLLLFAHLLLIVWMWWRLLLQEWVLFPELFCFVLAAPVQHHTRRGGQCDSQTGRRGKTSPKNNATTTKTKLQQEKTHKWHKGHPNST